LIKNYRKQGADHWVVDGLLEIGTTGELRMSNGASTAVKSGSEMAVESGGVVDVGAGALLRLSAGSKLSFSPRTPVNAKASALTTALAGDNNDLVFTAIEKGVAGDDITITYVDPGAVGGISVAVVGTAITVTLAYDSGAITSTANDVKAAIDADDEAKLLVTVAKAAANSGEGLVTAMAETALAGGVDGTVAGIGETAIDGTYLYIAIDDNTVADTNWRRIALGAAY
jgi:hypothetical protein